MPDTAKINDLVDGEHPDFGRFRGAVVQITPGELRVDGARPIPADIAHVAVLGFSTPIAVLRETLTVLQHAAIPVTAAPDDAKKAAAFDRIAAAYLRIPAGNPPAGEIAVAVTAMRETIAREVGQLHPAYAGVAGG